MKTIVMSLRIVTVICILTFTLLAFSACFTASGDGFDDWANNEAPDVDLNITPPPLDNLSEPTASVEPAASVEPTVPIEPIETGVPVTETPSDSDRPEATDGMTASATAPADTPAVRRTPDPGKNDGEIPPENRVVYLTFDDGPCKLSYELLDILDRYNVKATFFTVGYFVDRYPEIVREAESRGHLIACHTYSHDYDTVYKSADDFMNDIHRWEDAVERALGHLPAQVIIRFPGGSAMSGLSDDVRNDILYRLKQGGYKWYDWNCGNNDAWPGGNVDGLPVSEYLMQSYEKSIKWAFGGSEPCIFLAHETKQETIDMIDLVIEDLIRRGAEFRTLDKCQR